MMRLLKINILLLVFFGLACKSHDIEQKPSDAEVKLQFEKANKLIIRHERKDIDEFILRHQLKMDSTGTGLRYQIYSKGKGDFPHPHDAIAITYRVFFLDGNQVYLVPLEHPDTVRLAEGNLVNGLEELVAMMNEGAKARAILPAHLAFGMLGDDNKIPGATPLYYDLQLIKINP